jgi:hypothetical protein
MAKDPAFPWYASDWLGSNRRAMMTLEQQAAYMNLLCRQWTDKTCSLPDDDEMLAHLSELNEGWLNGGCQVLRPCFPKHPTLEGRIANPKLVLVREEREEWRRKSQEGGRKSGAVRRAKSKPKRTSGKRRVVEPPHEPNANQTRTKGEPNTNSPSPSPSPSYGKENIQKKAPLDDQAFTHWWAIWPQGKKTGKEAARKAYKAAVKRICAERACEPREARDHLQERLTAFVATPKCLGLYCPHPSTWLNGGRYDDDPSAWQDSGRPGRGEEPPTSPQPRYVN